MKEWITGRNPVYEVLRAKRRQAFRLLVAKGIKPEGQLPQILQIAQARRLPIEEVPRAQLDALANHHQGVALEASSYPYAALEDLLVNSQRQPEPPFFLLLDALQDPQNLGSLLRTAEAMGVHGVVLPSRQAAQITPAVVHSSSGASEHLLIAQYNLAQACLLYTSDAADDLPCVDLGGRRNIKKKKNTRHLHSTRHDSHSYVLAY